MADKVIWCNRGWQPVHFGFCPNAKAWAAEMKRMGSAGEPYPSSDARATVFNDKGKVAIIVTMQDGAESVHSLVEVVGMLIHEATHVWQEVRLAMAEVSPSIEFEAYSMQAIAQELIFAFDHTRGLPKG